MSHALFDSVTRIARHEAEARPLASIAVVTDIVTRSGLTDDHAVSVTLRERGVVLKNVPVAVGALGFVATPTVGDLVLVVFAEGDHHAPVVVGRLYHSDLHPPAHDPDQLVLALPPGDGDPAVHVVVDGSVPSAELDIGGTTALIDGNGAHITAGSTELHLDGSGSGEVTVTSGQSTLTLSGNGDAEFKASNNLTIEGVNVEIKGSAKVKITGAVVEIN